MSIVEPMAPVDNNFNNDKSLSPNELKRQIQKNERRERFRKRQRLNDNPYENLDDEVDDSVIDLFYTGEEKETVIDSEEELYVDISTFYNDSDDGNKADNYWDEIPDVSDWDNSTWEGYSGLSFDQESPKLLRSTNIKNYFTRKQSDWDKLCTKLDIDQRFFNLKTTQANGNCLFHSISIALGDRITGNKIKHLRGMVSDTILDTDNEEAKNVLLTWNMLYTMGKQENDHELMRHYGHMKCLEKSVEKGDKECEFCITYVSELKSYLDPKTKTECNICEACYRKVNKECEQVVEEVDVLSVENRQRVHDEMMKKDFWGEEYCLKVFERELNIKFVIMNSDKQKIEGTNNKFDAQEIVLLYYSGNHYQIVSYKDKHIFDIMEDLEDIETMLVDNDVNIYEVDKVQK